MWKTIELQKKTTAETDVIDLTDEVIDAVRDSGIATGQALVFTPGSTAAITTIEYEAGVVDDLRQALERLAPRNIPYAHDKRWGDGNGYSHVRAALVGASFTVPIIDGRPALGTWQQLVLLDFDNRARTRRIIVQLSGE